MTKTTVDATSLAPSRRALVHTAAWATPVILASAVTPAFAASQSVGTGVISFSVANQMVGYGATVTLTGSLTPATGQSLPSTVSLAYAGASVTGPATATVTASGTFTFTATSLKVESTTTITASAVGFIAASTNISVFVASTGVFRFEPSGSKNHPWTSAGRTTLSSGIVLDHYTLLAPKATSATNPGVDYMIAIVGALYLNNRLIDLSMTEQLTGWLMIQGEGTTYLQSRTTNPPYPAVSTRTIFDLKTAPSVGLFPDANRDTFDFNSSSYFATNTKAQSHFLLNFNNFPNYFVYFQVGPVALTFA